MHSNNVSLDLVGKNIDTVPTPTLPLIKEACDNDAEVSDAAVPRTDYAASTETQVVAAGPSSIQLAPTVEMLGNPIWEGDLPSNHQKLRQFIIKCFFYLLSACNVLQFVHQGVRADSFLTLDDLDVPYVWKTFPWKRMHIDFGAWNIQVLNWPEGVDFPPISADDPEVTILGMPGNAPQGNGPKAKAFHQLSRLTLYMIAKAIRNDKYPLHFRVLTGGRPTGKSTVTWILCRRAVLTDISGG